MLEKSFLSMGSDDVSERSEGADNSNKTKDNCGFMMKRGN